MKSIKPEMVSDLAADLFRYTNPISIPNKNGNQENKPIL
jgi:hypothetical protein